MKKALKWGGLAVLVLLVIGGVVLYFTFNRILRSTIETQTERTLQLDTSLQSANLALFGGQFSMDDLKIGSPEGFSAPHMLTLDGATVEVSYGQLRQQPVRIRNITLNAPALVIEQSGGRFNFQHLTDLSRDDPAPTPDEPAEPVRLIIDSLTIADARVTLRPGVPGLSEQITVSIPTTTLNQIGTGEGNQNGAEIRRVVSDVVAVLVEKAGENELVPAELRGLLTLNADQLKSAIEAEVRGRIQDEIDKRAGDLAEPLKDIVGGEDPGKAAEDALRGLIPGRKPEESKE